jgi:uncharacterized protein YndB with AHSA1/START domain
MPSAVRTIVVNRPVDHVFRFLSTPGNDGRWRSHVMWIHAPSAPAVGSRIRQVISGPGGRTMQADLEVTAYEPPARYAFRVVTGPVRPTGELTLTPFGEGTQVRFTLGTDPGLPGALLAWPLRTWMDREMACLPAAKRHLEQG